MTVSLHAERKIEFVYIRHGESTWNEFKEKNAAAKLKSLSHTKLRDAPLTPKGIEDAVEVGMVFSKDDEMQKFKDKIVFYSSPLERALHTLYEGTKPLGVEEKTVVIHPVLREQGMGIDCQTNAYDKSKAEHKREEIFQKLEMTTPPEWVESTNDYNKNKPPSKTIFLDLLNFVFEKNKTNETIAIIGGHSIYMKNIIAKYASEISVEPGTKHLWNLLKNEKMENGAILHFEVILTEEGLFQFSAPEFIHKCIRKLVYKSRDGTALQCKNTLGDNRGLQFKETFSSL
jgi:broad specificity phosphatase PhoE